jgi:hypothetical protein
MKRNSLHLILLMFAILISTSSCQPAEEVATPTPTPCPTSTASPSPTAAPTQRATQTPQPTPLPDYTRQFLDALPTNSNSCLPDKTADDLGIYIYDLKEARELVSINADVPLQFASAFKAPVLVYFLEACHRYWDPSSPEWQDYFQNLEAARGMEGYTSPEYKQAVIDFIADPANWKNVGDFFAEHRTTVNGVGGPIDTRYFILEKVYAMIAQSQNQSTADVLLFTYNNCLNQEQVQIEEACGGPNALTTFNAWFNDFSGIEYENGNPRRGLHTWDIVIENGKKGPEEIRLSTFGLEDACADQTAILKCDPAYTATNTFTARDFFKFYNSLYNLGDELIRETAFGLLKVDEPGPARGYLKNLTRAMHATSLSKNGHAFFTNGSINTDAGIVLYKGKSYIVVTLSFNALGSMTTLYGSYDTEDNLVSDPGLLQTFLEEYSTTSP